VMDVHGPLLEALYTKKAKPAQVSASAA